MTKLPPLESDLATFTATGAKAVTKTFVREPDPPLPDGFVWEDPPPSARGRTSTDWSALLAPLMAQPGRWARIRLYRGKTAAGTAAAELKSGKRRRPAGRWEFVGRKVDGGSVLYARYLGAEDR